LTDTDDNEVARGGQINLGRPCVRGKTFLEFVAADDRSLAVFTMPRNLLLSESEDESSDRPQQSFSINESYAKRLEHNKAREELHRLEAKYSDKLRQKEKDAEDEDEDEESTSESEDEIGELVTPQLDAKIWQTIAMIRDRRPEVYDATWKGFTEDDDESNEPQKKEKKEKVTQPFIQILILLANVPKRLPSTEPPRSLGGSKRRTAAASNDLRTRTTSPKRSLPHHPLRL
jgi:hypothetical protein